MMKIMRLGKSKRVRSPLIVFCTLLFLLVLADVFIHKHADLFLEGLLFFFPLYGFVSCVLIFSVAKGIAKILKRDSDYYES